MKILVFTEGTIIMHKSSIEDFSSYVPIKNAVKKLQKWKEKGVKILYLTSRTKLKEIQHIKNVLEKNNFPNGQLLYCKIGEEYKDVIERTRPDIFIDDDCESIGGNNIKEVINPKLNIKIIIVKEFGGIDHLPEDSSKLFEVNL